MQENKGLYIQLYSIHGLIRSENIEMGFDADTGGQVKYVVELAKALCKKPQIRRLDLVTRLIADKNISSDYSQPIESLCPKGRIVRIPCGGARYIKKEKLWPHLDEFTDRAILFLKREGELPDIIHTHYADAGYVGTTLSSLFGVPFIHTGHSLGQNKKNKLLEEGMSLETLNKRFFMPRRLHTEEKILKYADLIITSTSQEIKSQYGLYKNRELTTYQVIPPGLDLTHFYPFYEETHKKDEIEHVRHARKTIIEELYRFLTLPEKPMILSICRPDKRKNIHGLVQAYGEDKELQKKANLVIFAGIRKDIQVMDDNERDVLTEMLLLMDKYDLYGKMAIPKTHEFTYEIPELYRFAACKGSVFINPALTEPFGLTLLESSACGMPLVATDDGGPVDIIKNCENGILVNAQDSKEISTSLKKLLSDRKLWKKYSEKGIKNVRHHYTWDVHADKYIQSIEELYKRGAKEMFVISRGNPLGKRLSRLDRMIITDIDNTLVGDDPSLREFTRYLNDHQDQIAFGVASGRSVELVMEALKEYNFPVPDIIIAAVGAEIYYGEQCHPDQGWTKHISYRWDREKIVSILEPFDFLTLQDSSVQKEHKISYDTENIPDNLNTVKEKLRAAKCHYNMIFSHGKFLDILPFRASKGKAVRYLSMKWDIPLENIMVCGDSGNDREMLSGETLGVVVANYSTELEDLKGRRKIYFSDKPFAAGIMDGIHHYQLLEETRL